MATATTVKEVTELKITLDKEEADALTAALSKFVSNGNKYGQALNRVRTALSQGGFNWMTSPAYNQLQKSLYGPGFQFSENY